MKSSEEFVPNERLRRARSLKGWSQADLAEQVGTSFEIVSRWERGVTITSPYYRERLCAVLGQSAADLGLVRNHPDTFTPPSTPVVLLASSHEDAEKALVSQLTSALPQDRSARAGHHALEQPPTEQRGKRECTNRFGRGCTGRPGHTGDRLV